MNLLLDTHAWLWFALGQEKLSATARAAIEHPENVNHLSTASLWEIAIKISLGKYQLQLPFLQFVDQSIAANRISLVAILPRHIDHVATMTFPSSGHRDPFDRLLVSQAQVEGMTLVSNDAALDEYGVPRIW